MNPPLARARSFFFAYYGLLFIAFPIKNILALRSEQRAVWPPRSRMWPVAVLHVAVESLMHVSAMWVDDRRITFVVGSGLTLLILTLWLGVLLRECGEKKPRDCEEQGDVGCLVSIICISQFVPALGGEIMLAMLRNFSALVVIICYWTVSAIFLQFIKRCALVASNAGIAEAYCFPTQFAFDAFATLIFLQISFPKEQFFLVLAWTFVQVVFRDGDFKGIIQERVVGCLQKKARADAGPCPESRIQELKEHSGAFPH